MKQSLLAIIPMLVLPITLNVYASGPRFDYPSGGTDEEADCWVDGYDSGFAGKYDSDRAKDCLEEGEDGYNNSWDNACRDGGFTESQCADFINNPVDIEDYESLEQEITSDCFYDGRNDSLADRPFNKEESCELLIQGEKVYCPNNPDNVACVEFLHNATNKGKPSSSGACTWDPLHPGCPQVINPERYCLNTDDPVFCKTVGDICDVGGFVKPEYPYCK